LAAAGVALVFSVSASAQSAIITKARAFLGPEATLDAIKSVHYTGTLITADAADTTKQTRATIDIVFQKPEQQRIVATYDKFTETTALDGYEAWQRVQESDNPAKWRQTPMSAEMVKRLRANTWENLSFFRGIEKAGGRLEVMEPATVEGVACQKVAFIHAPNIAFVRCFDQSTGRLVLTETENGSTIKEEGEMIVEGIRFPKSIVTQSKTAAGKASVVTITFEKIQLNETFPPSLFASPSMGR
jgi:outer membrane lipoprotein-sorting protein